MMRKACALLVALVPAIVLWQGPVAGSADAPKASDTNRKVYFGTGLSDEDALVVTSAVAAAEPFAIVLLDSPKAGKAAASFLSAWKPRTVTPVGPGAAAVDETAERLGQQLAPPLSWERGPPVSLWKALFPVARRVVVAPAEPRRLLLHAACLAGASRAPLYVVHGAEGERGDLRDRLAAWNTKEVFAVGATADLLAKINDVQVQALADESAVTAAYLRMLAKDGPVRNVVVTNPDDLTRERGGMSVLAPWIALQRRAAVVLTNEAGTNATAAVTAALKNPEMARADTLVIVASLRSIPVEKRPNPVPGKDADIEMEPMTPAGDDPFTFGTGRLFHEDAGMLSLVLARQALLPDDGQPRKALVVSNPGGGLPLLETFSRHTVREMRNAGYRTTSFFENEADKDEVRKLLPEQDIFLWEGHYKTLTDEFGFLTWAEPLPPSLCFLQSCLALKEEEAQPLLARGAIAIVGSSTRTYSGTGGAFTLAYFNALFYENQTLGGALRQAKNYLLAYSILKEKRLGAAAKLTGVNVRSAWAFSLWGDPTLRLPRPPRPIDAREPVSHEFRGSTLVVNLPNNPYDKVKVGKYEAEMRPNARLAGLLRTPDENEDLRQLVPFVFVEVRLPDAPPGKKPLLTCPLSQKQWVFVWDARRKAGYLIITPRKERQELHFKIGWEA
jgi:Peptidase family C25